MQCKFLRVTVMSAEAPMFLIIFCDFKQPLIHTHTHLPHSFPVVFIHLQMPAAAASPHCFQVSRLVTSGSTETQGEQEEMYCPISDGALAEH